MKDCDEWMQAREGRRFRVCRLTASDAVGLQAFHASLGSISQRHFLPHVGDVENITGDGTQVIGRQSPPSSCPAGDGRLQKKVTTQQTIAYVAHVVLRRAVLRAALWMPKASFGVRRLDAAFGCQCIHA